MVIIILAFLCTDLLLSEVRIADRKTIIAATCVLFVRYTVGVMYREAYIASSIIIVHITYIYVRCTPLLFPQLLVVLLQSRNPLQHSHKHWPCVMTPKKS